MLDTDDEFTEVFDGEIQNVGNRVKSNIGAYSLFQILIYNINKSKVKTPLHVVTGHAVYTKCRSRGLITSQNKIGASISYKEVRKYRSQLASYTVTKGKDGGTPIPSHFDTNLQNSFVSGAFDNMNMRDHSSVSGSHSTNHCALAQYQDAADKTIRKPAPQEKGYFTSCLTESLPCQRLTHCFKNKERPHLEPHMKISVPNADEQS